MQDRDGIDNIASMSLRLLERGILFNGDDFRCDAAILF